MAQSNIVGTLFGPTPEELQKEERLLQQQYLMNASRVSPSYSAGAGLGSFLGGLFNDITGRESPEVAKAKRVQQVLSGVTQELSDEDRANKPLVMSKVATAFANDPMLQQEAMQATLLSAQYAKEDLESKTNVAYKDALIKSAEESVDRKNISTAYNVGQGLKALLNSNVDPEKFDMAFNSSVEKLKKKGIDTSFLEQADNIEDKVAGVDYLISLGTSEKGRTSADIAAQKAGVQERLLQYKKIIDDEKLKMQKYGIDSREGIAAKGRIAAMERAIVTANGANTRLEATEKNIFTRERLAERRSEVQSLDTEFQTKLDIKMLSEDFGLPIKDATTSVKNYQAKVKDYLNMKDPDGLPLYSVAKAQDMARQEFASGIKPAKGFFGKPSYEKGTTETPVVASDAPPANLLSEGKQTTFKNGQVWTLKNGKQTRVK